MQIQQSWVGVHFKNRGKSFRNVHDFDKKNPPSIESRLNFNRSGKNTDFGRNSSIKLKYSQSIW